MSKPSLIVRAGRGLLAGLVGTATMTAWQDLSAKLQSSNGGGDSKAASDPWADAPAPAKVGRLMLRTVGYDVPADRIGLLTNIMHWGYGTGWGVVYGVIMGEAAERRPLVRGLGFGAWVWLVSYAQLVPLGIYEPPWKYPPAELALDLSYHLAYGAGVGAAGGALARSGA